MGEVSDKEVKVTLVKALDLIEKPEGWIVGAECQIVGRHSGNHAPKFAYCSIGAVNAVTIGYRKPDYYSDIDAEGWRDIEAGGREAPECVSNRVDADKAARARAEAAVVALGEALEELDYHEVWDGWNDDEHDPDTASEAIVDFNDNAAEHKDVVKAFRKAIEMVAARMKGGKP